MHVGNLSQFTTWKYQVHLFNEFNGMDNIAKVSSLSFELENRNILILTSIVKSNVKLYGQMNGIFL